MSVIDKPNSLRWMLFILVVSVSVCLILTAIVTSFFEDEFKFAVEIVTLCVYMVILICVTDIWGDEIFTDPKYRINKEEIDNFLKQKIDFTQIKSAK